LGTHRSSARARLSSSRGGQGACVGDDPRRPHPHQRPSRRDHRRVPRRGAPRPDLRLRRRLLRGTPRDLDEPQHRDRPPHRRRVVPRGRQPRTRRHLARGPRRRPGRAATAGGRTTRPSRPRPACPEDQHAVTSPDLPRPEVPAVPDTVATAMRRLREKATSENTRAAQIGDWTIFTRWCERTGHSPMPATAEQLSWFLTEKAAEVRPGGRWAYAPSTLSRWVSTINKMHALAGLPKPGGHE